MDLKNASIIGLAVAALSIGTLVFQHSLFATALIPIVIQILAILLMVWARLIFGKRSFHAAANPTEGGLVTSGPYQFLRHPIYAAVLYFAWAGVLSHISIESVILASLITGGLAVRMIAEERLVAERYPEYISYAKRTKRVIPFIL